MRTLTMKNPGIWWVFLSLVWMAGCSGKDFGKVDQGRTIAFDQEKKTITFIRDKSGDPAKPDYSSLPPVTFQIPVDPAEMGPEPKSGLRMKLDTMNNEITFFDPAAQMFRTIPYRLVEQKEKVEKDYPQVFDRATGQPKKFPVVDRSKKTVTIYSSRQKTLTTFTVADQYLDLPEFTWDSGDEVRIYYKAEGKALRLMNVTKADIFKH